MCKLSKLCFNFGRGTYRMHKCVKICRRQLFALCLWEVDNATKPNTSSCDRDCTNNKNKCFLNNLCVDISGGLCLAMFERNDLIANLSFDPFIYFICAALAGQLLLIRANLFYLTWYVFLILFFSFLPSVFKCSLCVSAFANRSLNAIELLWHAWWWLMLLWSYIIDCCVLNASADETNFLSIWNVGFPLFGHFPRLSG